MQFDLWRALGVTAGSVVVGMVVSVFVYTPTVSLQTSDIIYLPFSVVILGIFSFLYFKDKAITPSLKSGFYLGCVMFGYTFLTGFLGAFLNATQGVPEPALPPPELWVMLSSALVGFAVPSFVGFYLEKKK